MVLFSVYIPVYTLTFSSLCSTLVLMQRIIALIDCDCFFVSCERVKDPKLQGKPVCVMTGGGNKGIIVSRSKEAKALGIKMGEPYFKVKVEHPEAICIPAHHDLYHEISQKVMDVIRDFTPDVEVVSVDEAYADVTGFNKLHQTSYTEFITNIRSAILTRTGIPVSIGLCSSKTLAKLASDKAKKCGGIYVIRPDKDVILAKVGDDPIDSVCGVGRQNSKHLLYNDVNTIREYVSKDDSWLRKGFGVNGVTLKHELLGETVSVVNPKPEPPLSIQNTSAFDDFSTDPEFLHSTLAAHIHNASKKLRMWDGYCSRIAVMVRTKAFAVTQAEMKLEKPTNSEKTLRDAAHMLLDQLYHRGVVYRATGITLLDLTIGKKQQFSLFESLEPEDDKLSRIIDQLENKYGPGIIKTL